MTSHLRRLALARQGLLRQPFGKGAPGVLRAIEHLGYVQVDTLSVVERAHHHVLWNRVPGYDQAHLNQLIAEKRIFEHWYHAASYLPMRDYRYALPHMRSIRNGESRYHAGVDKGLMREILARVRAEGPLRVRDLDKGEKGKGSWWSSGPSRRAIDKLFMQGDLMVCGRNGMEKVFDLAERCIPDGIDLSVPSVHEYALYLFETTLRAHGALTMKQLLHLKTGTAIRDAMRAIVDERIDAGLIKPYVNDDGSTFYVDTNATKRLPKVDGVLKVLSPFDNVVIHRDRLTALFEFDYRIECYVPAAKRVFGYFCLPILYGDRFVGRIDCKAHRSEGRFEIVSLHWEPGAPGRDEIFPALRDELQRFADFNQCPELDWGTARRFAEPKNMPRGMKRQNTGVSG